MIRLIIKGTPEQARAALDAHKLQTTMALIDFPESGEVDAVVHDDDLATVQAWFIEEPLTPPYPIGALLHHTPYKLEGM
jgi:hypothetical protein